MPHDQSVNPEYGKRLLRGHQMIEDGVTPNQLSKDHFEIPSSKGDKTYIVSKYAHKWQCTCPDHQFRHVSCKHIHAVTLWQKLTEKIQEEHEKKIAVAQPELEETITCKFCGSDHIIRYGKANEKQVYKCKVCARKFVPNIGFEKMWHNPKIVVMTLDLYFKGVSLRKISDHLRQCHGLEVDHSTVYRWVKRYIEIIGEYVSSLKPYLGNVWHADEMKIRIGGDWRWLWNVMDKRTRYQLVGLISKSRKVEDAQKAFRRAKMAGKKKPKLIITDGLQSYKGAFKSEFHDYEFSTRYAINSGFGLNSFIERMQENIREREKIMHGLKKDDTPFVEGSRIYYNFIRPHLGLYGATPAEMAGIGVNGSWEELLRRANQKRK